MSTLKTTYLQHPSATSPNLELNADGTVTVLPNGLLQVVSATKTDTFTTSSGSYTVVTGLSASITPSSASSKVLILATVSGLLAPSGALVGFLTLYRGSTNLANATSPGSRIPSFASNILPDGAFQAQNLDLYHISILDSPATTSSTTYEVRVRASSGGTVLVNRGSTDTDTGTVPRGISSITLIEIAG